MFFIIKLLKEKKKEREREVYKRELMQLSIKYKHILFNSNYFKDQAYLL